MGTSDGLMPDPTRPAEPMTAEETAMRQYLIEGTERMKSWPPMNSNEVAVLCFLREAIVEVDALRAKLAAQHAVKDQVERDTGRYIVAMQRIVERLCRAIEGDSHSLHPDSIGHAPHHEEMAELAIATLAAQHADTERLDWLEALADDVHIGRSVRSSLRWWLHAGEYPENGSLRDLRVFGNSATVRNVLDAARAAKGETDG
jgi:hypothetical protein